VHLSSVMNGEAVAASMATWISAKVAMPVDMMMGFRVSAACLMRSRSVSSKLAIL
jgi:hypothetical protein